MNFLSSILILVYQSTSESNMQLQQIELQFHLLYENLIQRFPLLLACSIAIAIACFCGLPAFISVRMFCEIIFFDFPFLNGM